MKLPVLSDPHKYTGLYAVDFGDSSSVGFTAPEVAELLDSEKFAHIKVYKIHRAGPDGELELRGVARDIFGLENGMFFFALDENNARRDYMKLVSLAVSDAPPSMAKAHLARWNNHYVTALIYPAEYNDEISRWLRDNHYRTDGPVEAGISQVAQYYRANAEILERHQFIPDSQIDSLTGEALLKSVKKAVQR